MCLGYEPEDPRPEGGSEICGFESQRWRVIEFDCFLCLEAVEQFGNMRIIHSRNIASARLAQLDTLAPLHVHHPRRPVTRSPAALPRTLLLDHVKLADRDCCLKKFQRGKA